ncbi:COX15/CtaA family protein [Microbulbifer sp. OS29]|uniref:COX15/CtaA family protein n=1 Tax=Microbulbifer okhotskensis TaxID=2926617 RepID=A0A9X2J4Z1_9GAMM|nr:COX15/CtaA family protein [Microbulbifer okhotskensis]MCO1333045.1 COX15/CtaA family protein [Microbulbifer okhotskensis]
MHTQKSLKRLTQCIVGAACVITVVVVTLGAFTRLVDAGLGCPDWPGCYGHLTWPVEQSEIRAANSVYPESPVDASKTWPEMVHRYFAGTLLLLVGFLVFLMWKNPNTPTFKQTHILLLVILLQAAFGMWTVTLKLWPQVVTAHLLGGMATLSLLWIIYERLHQREWRVPIEQLRALKRLRPLALVAVVVVILQIALGGWTSSNYAALACPDFPTCHGEWLPRADFSAGFNITQKIGPNYLGGALENDARTAIHFAHRLGGLLVTLIVLILATYTWRTGAIRWAIWLSGVLTLQLSLGIANVVMFLPLGIAVAHNAGAALLLLSILTFIYRIGILKAARIDRDEIQLGRSVQESAITLDS